MVLTITRDKVKCESLVLAIECIKLIPRVYRDNCKNRPFTPVYARLCPRPTYFCRSGAGVIGVGPPPICDDTDVFALLIHYVHTENIENTIIMQATKNGHPIIDIHEVIEKMIAEKLDTALIIQVHALSGCDTVAAYYRKGKQEYAPVWGRA